jgi:hypothetical protein
VLRELRGAALERELHLEDEGIVEIIMKEEKH